MNKNKENFKDWHALSAAECALRLDVDPARGLGREEISKRQALYGLNQISKKKGTPAWLRFLSQFQQPLVYILLAASLVTFILKEWVDSGVIFGVVLINALIGFIQESRALNALDALSKTMTALATVFRDGQEARVPSTDLVPGDIVLLTSGDKVPADMRLFYSKELQVNESALTGESLPVQKNPDPARADCALADRRGMVYASTLVTYGQGRAVVTATGDETEVGRISELISSAENLETPLTKKIEHFSHWLLYIILGLAALTFAIGLFRGQPAVDMFMVSVALAVSAIPEGLPAAVTITLAIGVARMARRKAVIRKLPAVETLGSTMIICSDKTGTLTENQMTVQEIFAGGHLYAVSGGGYEPAGEIFEDGKKINAADHPVLSECLIAGLLCNDSRHVSKNDGRFEIEGDPTEGALIVAALKAGFSHEKNSLKRLDSIPFESEKQYMATLHERGTKPNIFYVKGAVEKIVAHCPFLLDGKGARVPFDSAQVIEQTRKMAAQGLRILAFARGEQESSSLSHSCVEKGLIFLGLQGMMDPPRREAMHAIRRCHSAGIEVKMITGDHVVTAAAIARQLGLKKNLSQDADSLLAVTGAQMSSLSELEFMETAEKASVFARVTPEQKLQLVRTLQSKGNIVAMTGDGVNDAPALKQANIGVAMGLGGTEVAKEAADMVLTDDNFASIEAAVEEGRCVYDNLRKFIVWTFPTNLGEALAIMAAIFAGTTLPVVPVQILWINMTTAVCLGLMLAFEPKEPEVMMRPPRNPKLPIMTRGIMIRTFYVGFLLVCGVFGLFLYEINSGASLEQARSVAVGMLVIGELFYLFNCRSLTKSVRAIGFFSNPQLLGGVSVMIALQLFFTYSPLMNKLFHSAPISLDSWMRIAAVSFLISIVVAGEKKIRNRVRLKADAVNSKMTMP